MITALLLSTLAVSPADASILAQTQAPIQVWLNKRGDVRRGDRVRVYARTEGDGYLLVLHAEPDGRIRILVPSDPFEDNYVRGGRDMEIRGRGDREAFRIYESQGVGTVYAAYSRDPFRVDAFIRGDHWDYRLFDSWRLNEELDPEAELTALVQEMAGGTAFSYDLTHYYVGERVADRSVYYGSSHYYPGSWNFSLGWGWSPWWSVSYGWGRYWDPWYDPYWYDPWAYSWRHTAWRPYYWYSGYYYPRYYYYPRSYVSYGYPSYYSAGNRYNGSGYYTTPFGSRVRGQYTFKSNDRSLANGGITVRRRTTAASNFGLRSNVASRATARLSGRQAPAATSQARRVPTGVSTTGRRVAPSSTDARRGTTSRVENSGRRVQPSGWGISDGRRTITPSERPSQTATERRRVIQPSTRPQAEPRTRSPERASDRGTVTRRSTTRSTVQPPSTTRNQSGTVRRRSTTTRQAPAPSRTPTRVTPQRSTTPSKARTPTRVTPQRSAPRPSTRSAPRRTTPKSSTVRAPARTSRPAVRAPARAPARSSSPVTRAPSRAPSRSPARAPTRSSGKRKGSE
ncbi:MAG: DUF4384 domain-containing protein [Gemmatimonadota bacterium]|nr:DUF4384 domain-containing protein [Gemmatimonadota bacterium]